MLFISIKISTKAQAWFTDFAIALLLFSFTVVIYLGYTTNVQKQEEGDVNIMLKDVKSITSSLVLSGYPNSWDNTTVIRIGIADDHNINSTKLRTFKKLNYSSTRTKFSTIYDYFVFFINSQGEILNIYGVCGVGYPLINITYNIRSAYYYSDDDDKFLKDFMNETFKADIYFGDNPQDDNDIDSLVSNLSKYGFLVLEHALLTGGDFDNFKDKFNNYSSRGGLLMISGELATPSVNDMVGADFRKKSGQSSSQRTAIVNNTDVYLSFIVGQSMVFNQYYYVENKTSSTEFKIIATFNQTDDKAIARWKYGNGTVYFFSDFDVSYFSGNFINIVEEAATSMVGGTCTPLNLTAINPKKLVKTERFLSYNGAIITMVIYLWQ